MFRFASLFLLCSALSASAVTKTMIDLMVEGRFAEVKTLIADNTAGARYASLLAAMTEPDAQAACALYRKVSEAFPGTDCDSLAQERLLLALDIGVSIVEEELIPEPEEQFTEATPAVEEIEPVETMEDETPVALMEPDEGIDESEATEPVDESSASDSEERILISSIQKPGTTPITEEIPVPSIEPEAETSPATTGITVEYNDESIENSAIQQASATPEQSLVIPAETNIEPAVETAQSTTEAMPIEQVADEKTPVMTEPIVDHKEDMALLETKPGVKPLPLADIPHDLDIQSNKNGDWFVQVGAFGNHDNALRLAAKLRSARYPVILVPRETETATLMQVRVGGYASRDTGKQIAKELKSEYNVPAVLVSK